MPPSLSILAVTLRYEYYHDGVLRWDLGWASPNFGGAFVAMLLPLAWGWAGRWPPSTRGASLRFAVALVVEAAACFLLAKTQSRGALLAAVGALLWFHACLDARPAWRMAALRLALLAACVLATGFGSRMAPGFVESDASVTNRWDVLKGGLQLLASAPVFGWGEGMSGRAYMEWFQPADQMAAYLTLLNGFLTLGVEHGGIALFAALSVVGWVQLGCWRSSRGAAGTSERTRVWLSVVGASLFAWWIASLFSNLWSERLLWIVPGLALAVALGFALRLGWFRAGQMQVSAVALALMVTLGGIVAGRVLGVAESFAVSPRSPGVVEFRRLGTGDGGGALHLWCDWRVVGPRTGRLVKAWAEQAGLRRPVVVHYGFETPERALPGEADVAILFGRHVERLDAMIRAKCRRIVLVHPSGVPPAVARGEAQAVEVILPGIDPFGTNPGWTAWAESTGASVKLQTGIGAYMPSAWAKEMNYALGGGVARSGGE